MALQKNQIVPLRITSVGHEGNGVGRHEGMAVFVPRTAPGDLLRARIVKVQKNYAYGIVEQLLEPSPDRVEPDCPVYARCGGCSLRHLRYDRECRIKEGWLADNLRRIAGLELPLDPMIPSPLCARYRNKAQYPIRLVDGRVRAGFFAKRTHTLIPAEDCLLQPESFSVLARTVCAFLEEKQLAPYDERTGTGLVRHLYLREAQATGQLLVCLVLNGRNLPYVDELAARLRAACPAVTTLVFNENTRNTNVIFGERTWSVFGPGTIEDELCGVRVRLSALSFYQVNRPAAELLYRAALDYAGPGPDDRLLDLYCGTGTIGLSMAHAAGELVGVETSVPAVEDARWGAARGGFAKARFLCMDARTASAELLGSGWRPDIVLLDPPRKGVDPQTIGHVVGMAPKKIVYISCDSATLARDLKLFALRGYPARRGRAVDLFPRTAHVESVVLLCGRPAGDA